MPDVNSHGHDASGEHLVQFYANDTFLINGISDHIGSAIAAGDIGVVIATKPHLNMTVRTAELSRTLQHRPALNAFRPPQVNATAVV